MVWNNSDALYLYLGGSCWNVGQNTRYPEDFLVILSPSTQILPRLHDDRFRPNLLYFINQPNISSHVVSDTECVVL